MSSSREMDHKEAVETMAAQRYVLDEMTPEDQDAFEEHFFGCAGCAADVKDSEAIADTLRSDKNNLVQFTPRKSPSRWLAAAASFIFAAILGFQNLVTIPHFQHEIAMARAPHIVQSLFLKSQSRGEEEPKPVNASEALMLDFDVTPNARSYVAEVVDASGHVRIHESIPAERVSDDGTVHLSIPAGFLTPGKYSLRVLTEPAGSPDSGRSFTVR
jgi:putative zinc finger protein